MIYTISIMELESIKPKVKMVRNDFSKHKFILKTKLAFVVPTLEKFQHAGNFLCIKKTKRIYNAH